jgi:GMP synthase (glutamine-hydrolysing)
LLEQGVERVAVIDFGGQYTHLIARRIRALGVYSEVFLPDEFNTSSVDNVVGIILSGSPSSVASGGAEPFALKSDNLPVLGLCYGHQLLAEMFGGEVSNDGPREYGPTKVRCDSTSPLFIGIEGEQTVWMSHGDHVSVLPPGFRVIAHSETVEIAGLESPDKRIFGLQFHPEVTHTVNGQRILDNFVGLCTQRRTWDPGNLARDITDRIRREARERKLFLLVSGGVDSLVCLSLSVQAVGRDRVLPLHVDTGFMRKDESKQVMEYLGELGLADIMVEDASGLFFESLRGVIDPEEKRRIMGRLFVEIVDGKLKELGLDEDWMLVQGTIYPDTIESAGTKGADRIKTHHNRVEEIQRLLERGNVIEPLRDLYKDEVRALGEELGLPRELLWRHPFPGPGLAVRIIASDGGAADPRYDEEQRSLQEIVRPYGLEGMILPVRSVGVQGDSRTYSHPAVLWSADDSVIEWDNLFAAASEVLNSLRSVNRVMLSTRPVGSHDLVLGKNYLTEEHVSKLQEIDAVVNDRLSAISGVWQVPVVSLPLYDGGGSQAFVMRPVCSADAMTADAYRIDFGLLDEIVSEVLQMDGVSRLFYDITSKPPATIEWE